jgi:alanine dehydrogenase
MKIGIPCEVKTKEKRVSCTPGGVRMLVSEGHRVFVQQGAGSGSGFHDEQYMHAGAAIVPTAADAWSCEMVIKVKEPIASEYQYLRPGLVLFTYLHLAAAPELTQKLLETKTVGIAYETVQVGTRLPLLEPMSEIAGRMSAIVGANYLSGPGGGKGVLRGGVPGVLPGKVLVIGGGTAGVNAGRIAAGLGADVTILEVDLEKMRFLDVTLHSHAATLFSNEQNLLDALPAVDLLIGAVLVPGAKAPKLIRREMLDVMQPGSVFVDIAIYVEHGVIHYCVANMPGAYARTATQALTNATMPYAVKIANMGYEAAMRQMADLRPGLNTHQGAITYKAVAEAFDMPYQPNPFA